mgnify:CR=1 FL=1
MVDVEDENTSIRVKNMNGDYIDYNFGRNAGLIYKRNIYNAAKSLKTFPYRCVKKNGLYKLITRSGYLYYDVYESNKTVYIYEIFPASKN